MTWPSSDVTDTHVDSPTDAGDPAAARVDILDLITKFNLLRNHVTTFAQTMLGRATAALARTDLEAAKSGDNADVTGLTAITTIHGGPLAGFRNKLYNASGIVATRVAPASSIPDNVRSFGTVDRWAAKIFLFTGMSGFNLTSITGGIANGFTSDRVLSIGASSGAGTNGGSGTVLFSQRLELADTAALAGKTVVLSCKLRALNSLGTHTAYLNILKASGADSFSSTSTLATSSASPVTLTNAAAAAALSLSVALSAADVANGIEVQIVIKPTGDLTGAVSYQCGDAQLEVGSTPTSYEQRPVSIESPLCQRYHYALFPGATLKDLGIGFSLTSTIYATYHTFPVSMRIPPVVTPESTIGASAFAYNLNGATTNLGTYGGINATQFGANVLFNATGLTVGQGSRFLTSSGSGATSNFGFDAEL